MSITSIIAVLTLSLIVQNVVGLQKTNEDLIVNTNVGSIRGLGATDGDYDMFMGIPYAKVDEANPFGLSTPYPPFDEIFNAFDDSSICPQIEEFNNTIVGTLDCLHLNIYVPRSANSTNRLPVLVNIYGGGFSIGFHGRVIYGPKYLVRHDIVLVTLNYRVGPYGFMCLDTPEVPGNQGIKDQLLALRWVKNNIEYFGGDPNEVTIAGNSAGGGSVDLLLIHDTETLFNKVVMQSGTSMTMVSTSKPSALLELAETRGMKTTNVNEALSFLATVHPHTLIEVASQQKILFLPCVEQNFQNVERMVTDYTMNLDIIPNAKNVAIMIGFNNDELISLYASENPQHFETMQNVFYSVGNSFNFDSETLDQIEKIIRNFYIGDEAISINTRFQLAQFSSDNVFLHPAERSLTKYLKNGANKVYKYMFSYVGNKNFVKRRNNITIGGAAHADELGYLFDMQIFPEVPTPEDQLIIDRMTALWANFAKYGDPTPAITPLLPVKWSPITQADPTHYYLNIDKELTLSRKSFHQRTAFWDLFFKSYGHLQTGYKSSNKSSSTSIFSSIVYLLLAFVIV